MKRRSIIAGASALLLSTALPRARVTQAQEEVPNGLPSSLDPLPDGKVVFQQSSGGNIYLMNSDGSDLRVIAQGLEPAISPDGGSVIYSRWTDPAGIYVYDIAEEKSRRIYSVVGARWPAFSPPRGEMIAYYEPVDSARLVQRLVFYDENQKTDWVNDSGWRISLLKGNEPGGAIPGPTSFQIVSFGVRFFTDPSTGETRNVTFPEQGRVPESWFSPAWSPDGKELVYHSTQGLYRVNLRKEPEDLGKVPNTDFRFKAPQWSPDGTRILFLYKLHDHYEIGWISADGKSGLQLLTRPTPFQRAPTNAAPAYSPDGTKIAFLSDREFEGVFNIYTMNTDGSNVQKLLDLPIVYENQFERSINWGK